MFILLTLLACAPGPEGLRRTPPGEGPLVRVDWDAKPLADIPFPNDLATRPDPSSPTGLRLNLPTASATAREEAVRRQVDTLDGFGVYAPISVAFEAPLDLADLATRHKDDGRLGRTRLDDDAVLLIDVDPDSPHFGEAVELDLGEGRYPMDATRGNRYFPNDPRADQPSLVFDTVDEDTNGNGVLDWGEDTDNDGILDVPNVFPEGGDPRADLLGWYEKPSNTLILRPVVPLEEGTTYAVVLTDRLVGEDGSPVRSPWAWINHTRQTDALLPLEDILPEYGLSLEHVGFAWTFTTGTPTGDLVAIQRGLSGEGPLAAMASAYPASIYESLPLHTLPDAPPDNLPAIKLADALADVGLIDGSGADLVLGYYRDFADVVVGGHFRSPYLLADRDGDSDADEAFEVDRQKGTWVAEERSIAFTCVIPKGRQGPAPVAMYGHGYGSSRVEFLGFAWAFARMGIAACAFDAPGHGLDISPDELELVRTLLRAQHLEPFLDHLDDDRARDLDNDGRVESGGDQWSADAFHTRDMVRQNAVDWMQFDRALRACGTGSMLRPDGTNAVSCDWDGDGSPDIGGPDVPITLVGGSLGGINVGVAAPVIPDIAAAVPIVPGGGLLDVAMRTEIGGAVEAMVGRLLTPMFLGYPDGKGGLVLTQLVNSVTDMVEVPVAHLPSYPAGGRVILENLDNGEVREGLVPVDGRLRIAVPADGADVWEKARLAGIPAEGAVEGGPAYSVPDNAGLGDHLVLRFETADGQPVATVDHFEGDVIVEGVTYLAGSPLVATSGGYGHIRGTPTMRRVAMALGLVLEPGDPIAYARHYVEEPFEELGGKPTNVFIMPTPGDSIVSINTGIALARAAGYLDRENVDPRYGMTIDQYLIDRKVVHGLEEYDGYTGIDGQPCLFDVDDLDEGTDGTGAPSDDVPLRVTLTHEGGVGGLRLPYVQTTGSHAFGLPEPDHPFDIAHFAIMQAGVYLASEGQLLSDDICLEDGSCDFLPEAP